MTSFVAKVRNYILSNKMVEPGDKILVAVSGGADSVALLHCLNQLKDKFQLSLVVAHLNHNVRGAESDEDVRFVTRLAEQLGVGIVVDSIDAKAESGKLKTSFQEGARILRYGFFESAMKLSGANRIAVGHNSDDSVETVLINLLRGCGMKGLSGIPPVRGKIIRPLLCCSRAEVESFLKQGQWTYRTDSSNFKPDYLRNKIRIDLIPKLEDEFSQHIKSHILRTAEIIRQEDEFLESMASLGNPTRKQGDGCVLKRDDIISLHPAMRRRVIRRAIADVTGDLRRITTQHIDQIIQLMGEAGRKQIHLPGFLRVTYENNEIAFNVKPISETSIIRGDLDSAESLIRLKIPGITEVQGAKLGLHAHVYPGGDFKPVSPQSAYLDYGKTGENIVVRYFQPGDRFTPLGMNGSKKLKSFFIDEKVPFEARKTIPILTTQEGRIVWVYGMRIDQHYRVTPETRYVLHVEGKPLGQGY